MTHEPKPLIPSNAVTRTLFAVITTLATVVTGFMLNSILNIEANGRLILADIEDVQIRQGEHETELDRMAARIDHTQDRIDRTYDLVMQMVYRETQGVDEQRK